MNYFVALSSTQDTAEQIEFFFSKAIWLRCLINCAIGVSVWQQKSLWH